MLKHSDDSEVGERADIGSLLQRLAQEGRDWAEAEAALARIEIAELKKRVVKTAVLAGLAGGAVLCMMLALTQALITSLSGMITSVGGAALVVAGLFAVIAAVFLVAARRAVVWRTESIFFRWLGARS